MRKRALRISVAAVLVLVSVPFVVLSVAALLNSRTASPTDLAKSTFLANVPEPVTAEIVLRIVTFNVHDLFLVANDRPERMRAIGEALTTLDPDLVGIQESFIASDRQTLLAALVSSRLAYHRYYPSGTVGSGLFVLSAFPIEEAFFHRFERNGKWYKPYHGDWWAGKGVALARVALPAGAGYLDFYDTHAHAGYGSNEYDADRESQMRELAVFIRASAAGTAPAFLVGDMNCRPGSKAFQIAVDEAGLSRLMTVDTHIDHIFGVRNPRYAFEVLDTQPIDREIAVAGRQTHLSDHTGYMSTIRIRPAPDARPN